MKKTTQLLIALASLMLTTVVFAKAENVNLSNYYSAQHPRMNVALAATANFVPATDITIVNNTPDYIFVGVPHTPIYDRVASGATDHIFHDTNYGPTELQLEDYMGYPFFDDLVSARAVVIVSRNFAGYVVEVH